MVIKNSAVEETEVKTDKKSLEEMMNQIGIQMSSSYEETYKLLIWNDDVNSMEYVMSNLIEICGLTVDESYVIMMEAHVKGKSVAKIGSYEEVVNMKDALNKKMIEATVEK